MFQESFWTSQLSYFCEQSQAASGTLGMGSPVTSISCLASNRASSSRSKGCWEGGKKQGCHVVEADTLQHRACASVLLALTELPQTGQPNLRFPLCLQVTVIGGNEQEPTLHQAGERAENRVGHW